MSTSRKHVPVSIDMTTPVPVWCVGSYDAEGQPNVMTASWAGIVCSRPPCIAVSLREATHSYHNIMAQKAFTVSVPSAGQYREADFFGMASGKKSDKFSASKTTPVKSGTVNAPYVGEFPLVIECELKETVALGLHTLFVGEIKGVQALPVILNGDAISAEKLAAFFFAPSEGAYYKMGERLAPAFSPGREFMGK